jgi:hypothetical protein
MIPNTNVHATYGSSNPVNPRHIEPYTSEKAALMKIVGVWLLSCLQSEKKVPIIAEMGTANNLVRLTTTMIRR